MLLTAMCVVGYYLRKAVVFLRSVSAELLEGDE